MGRISELQQIAALLSNPACRMLTLVGPGGIGKTRLALEAAPHIPAPDGVHFVPFQPLTSPDFMVSAIAEALGIQFYAGADPGQQLVDYLQDKAILLVLDNLEHLLDGVSLFSEILAAAPDVGLLITSRERLNLREEWVLDVGGLACPADETKSQIEDYDAVRLFVQHARRVKADFSLTDANKSAVTHISQLVGGMPLALELAAAWVRVLPCEVIAEEIAHSLDILETAARNIEPRHRSMRAAFEPTWERLTEAERAVFSKLSVFRGGFTHEAAAQVAGATLSILAALVDKSLLRVDANGRYDLHELLRQFAWEKLSQPYEGIAAVLDRHCDYFTTFLHKQEKTIHLGNQAIVLQEMDNFRTAWRYAAEYGKQTALRRAAGSLHWLYHFQGWHDEGAAMFYLAEETLRGISVSEDSRFLLGMMILFRGFFRPDQPAQAKYPPVDIDAALALWEGVEERPEMGLPLSRAQLRLLANLSPPAQVMAIAQKCLTFSRNHHDLSGVAIALTTLAAVTFEALGEFSRAQSLLEEALLIDRQIGFHLNARWSEGVLGSIAYIQGQYKVAQAHHEASVAHYHAGGISRSFDTALFTLGNVTMELGDDFAACAHFEESVRIASSLKRQFCVAKGRAGLGILAALQGDIRAAAAHYEASHADFRHLVNDAPNYCPDMESTGLLALLLGHHQQALAHYEAIRSQYESSDYRMPQMCAHCRAGQALLGLGDETRATAYLFASLHEAADMGAWQVFLEALLGIAQLSVMPPQLAVELMGMIGGHPASNRYSRSRAKHLLAAMEDSLTADDFAAALERGQSITPQTALMLVESLNIATTTLLKLPQPLNDPLSQRECDVLVLIAAGFNNQEIADQLFIGISTVKKHINHIYSKLDVTHRAQAVARARTLKILP